MVPHLENEEASDEFGDIEGEGLMLAESSAPPLTSSNIKLTTLTDFHDESTTKGAFQNSDLSKRQQLQLL